MRNRRSAVGHIHALKGHLPGEVSAGREDVFSLSGPAPGPLEVFAEEVDPTLPRLPCAAAPMEATFDALLRQQKGIAASRNRNAPLHFAKL